MTQDHPYGYEVCIDYCGQTWPYFDSKQHLRHGSVFVITWAASYMTFAMVVPGQTTKCTCEAIGKAFQYFGYIPYNLQFDNGTAAVVKHTVGAETIFNDSFHQHHLLKTAALSCFFLFLPIHFLILQILRS